MCKHTYENTIAEKNWIQSKCLLVMSFLHNFVAYLHKVVHYNKNAVNIGVYVGVCISMPCTAINIVERLAMIIEIYSRYLIVIYGIFVDIYVNFIVIKITVLRISKLVCYRWVSEYREYNPKEKKCILFTISVILDAPLAWWNPD